MKYYQGIDTLSIFLFNKIHETGDKRYLIKVDDIEYLPKKVDNEQLDTIWDHIQYLYNDEIEKTRKRNNDLDTIKLISKLKIEKLIIQQHLILFELDPQESGCLKFLISKGYVPTHKQKTGTLKDRMEFVNEVSRRVKTIDGKIAVLEREISKSKEDGEQSEYTFDDLVLVAEKHIGRKINTRETSVKEWIHIENDLLKTGRNGKNKE